MQSDEVTRARHAGTAHFWPGVRGVRGIVDRLPYRDGVDAALARDHTLEWSQQHGTLLEAAWSDWSPRMGCPECW